MLVRTESHIPLHSAREARMNYEGPVILATVPSMHTKYKDLPIFSPQRCPDARRELDRLLSVRRPRRYPWGWV